MSQNRKKRRVIATRTPDERCASCGVHLDAASGIGERGPQAGDISLCHYCGALARFDAELRRQPLAAEEIRQLPPETLAQLAAMSAARNSILTRNKVRAAIEATRRTRN